MDTRLLDQLREKYKKAASQYGKRYFDEGALEGRITHLLVTRGEVASFLAGEMELFEKAVSIAEQKAEQARKVKEANDRMDAIIAELDKRLEKYEDIFFHPAASLEMRRLVGAVNVLISNYVPLVNHLFRGAENWTQINDSVINLERFYNPRGGHLSMVLKNYIDELQTASDPEREVIERKYKQLVCENLYLLWKGLTAELESMADFQKNRKISPSVSIDPEIKESWAGRTEKEFAEMVIQNLDGILSDFRMRDLVEMKFSGE